MGLDSPETVSACAVALQCKVSEHGTRKASRHRCPSACTPARPPAQVGHSHQGVAPVPTPPGRRRRLHPVQFRVLGPVELAGQEGRVSLGSERRRTILAVLLAARGEVVSVGRLVDAVWGTAPPATATKSLRSHVSRLRVELSQVQAGAARALITTTDGYRLALATDELDAARFEELLAAARSVMGSDPGEAAEPLAAALDLWRGPAFGELAANEAVCGEALRLERLRADAAADLVDARLALGHHRQVIGELEARVAADPLEERARSQLMVALYRSGRQADALAAYWAVQQRLREELGVDPSPSLQTLHEQMLRQAPGFTAPPLLADHSEDVGAGGSPRGRGSTPPMATAQLIGRDDDVRSVGSLMVPACVVTLTGPGGVGKTGLADRVAADVADDFDDGVVRVALAAIRDPDSVGPALLAALELPQPGDRGVEEALVAGLGTRRLLLVLDNCEHVLAAASQLVDAVVRRCPNVAVLATSREPLRLSGERVWQVAPLAVPPPGASAAEVAGSPAGALFCARAQAAVPGFALTEADAGAVAQLCRQLDGLPLAIELAAARVRAMSPPDLRQRLSDRFALLTGGPPHEGGRHRTLQTVVAWSYDLLTGPEAVLFDRLSVFASAFTLEAAEEVGAGVGLERGAVAGVVAELADKSMVSVERRDGQVRYRLLDTLRAFAAARLAERGEADAVRRAHADHHLALAERVGPRVRGRDEAAAVAEIEAVVDDLRVAHAWLVSAGDVDGALRLPTALCDYVLLRLRDEMLTWIERALSLPGAGAHPRYPLALAIAAMGATHRGQLDRARGHADAALARASSDPLASLWALDALRVAALFEGRLDDVLAVADRMAAAADAVGEDYHRAFVGVDQVLAHRYRGQGEVARAQAARLEEAAESSGNPTMRAWARYCHGEALMDTDPDEAARCFEGAIELAAGVGSLPEGVALVSLASLCGRRGEADRALELFRDVIARWRRLGNYSHQLTTLRNLVEVLARLDAGAAVDEPAARLHGAVTAAATPSFGVEAQRLASAWARLEQRLGADAAHAAAVGGTGLTVAEVADEALALLAGLLDG